MLGFHCDCSDDSGEPMLDWETSWETASSRPNIWCEECGRWIHPGETYKAASGVHPGNVSYADVELYYDTDELSDEVEEHREYFDTCLGCTRIAERFCSGGYSLGQLAEQVEECLGFYYPDDDEPEEDWEEVA